MLRPCAISLGNDVSSRVSIAARTGPNQVALGTTLDDVGFGRPLWESLGNLIRSTRADLGRRCGSDQLCELPNAASIGGKESLHGGRGRETSRFVSCSSSPTSSLGSTVDAISRVRRSADALTPVGGG